MRQNFDSSISAEALLNLAGATAQFQRNRCSISPVWLRNLNGICIYLAGIYRYEENQKLPVLSILTRDPVPEIAFIHDRMPVIFSDKLHGQWLDRAADPMEVLKLCEKEMAYRAA